MSIFSEILYFLRFFEKLLEFSDENKSFFKKDWFSGWFASKTKQNDVKEDPYPRIIKNDLTEKNTETEENEIEATKETQKDEEKETPNLPKEEIIEVLIFLKQNLK